MKKACSKIGMAEITPAREHAPARSGVPPSVSTTAELAGFKGKLVQCVAATLRWNRLRCTFGLVDRLGADIAYRERRNGVVRG